MKKLFFILLLLLFPLISATSIDSTFLNNELVVSISNTQDLSGFQFNVNYNPDVLSVSEVIKGDFLESDGKESFFSEGKMVEGAIENIVAVRLGQVEGVTGSGTLAKIKFTSRTEASPDISISNTIITNSGKEEMDVTISETTYSTGDDSRLPQPNLGLDPIVVAALVLFALAVIIVLFVYTGKFKKK